jgi:glucose/arabinose dehydrogenase
VHWVAVHERDELGDHVPPDCRTGLKGGAFYVFPYSYYGQHVDQRVKPQNPDLDVRSAQTPSNEALVEATNA